MTPALKGSLLSAAGMIALSPDAVLVRLAGDVSLIDMMLIRSTLMGVGMTLALAVVYRGRFWAQVKGVGRYGWLAAVLMTVSNYGFVAAIQTTSAANALVLFATMPFIAAVLGWALIGERVSGRTWAAIVAVLAGVAILVSGSLGGGGVAGDLTALGVAVLQGLNLVVLRKMGDRDMTPTLALSGFMGGLAALPFADLGGLGAQSAAIIAFQGLIQMPIALSLFIAGTRYIPAAEVAILALLETALGPLWVWLVIGEVPPPETLLGGAVIIGAVVVNAGLALKRGHGG